MPALLPLLAALAIIIAAAKLAGTAANRLGQPAVMGELVVGLLMGPSILGLFDFAYFAGVEATLQVVGALGVIFLMFAAGLEVEFDDFLRAGRPALLAGACGVLASLGLGILVAGPFGYSLKAGVFVGIVMSATSISIAAHTLVELGQLQTRAGLTLLGAAVVDDVLALLMLSAFVVLAGSAASSASGASGASADPAALLWIVIRLAVFFGAAIAIGRLMPRLVAWGDRLPVSQGAMAWAIVVVLVFAWASEAVGGVAGITGAFLAGLALGRSHLHKQISAGVHTLTYSFFVPVFLVNIGLSANFRQLSAADLGLAAVVCLAAVVAKIAGSGLGARLGGLTWPEAWQVGTGMVSRGEVNLIVAGAGVSLGLVSNSVFSIAVMMVLFTALITPALVRRAFPAREAAYATARRIDH